MNDLYKESKKREKIALRSAIAILALIVILSFFSGITKKDSSISTKGQEVMEVRSGFSKGTHIVGSDIEPGTYRSENNEGCYRTRLAGYSNELEDIIANGNDPYEIVTILSTDTAFQTRCYKRENIENTYPLEPKTTFRGGTFEVGKHIEPGTYRASGNPDDSCYWSRLSNFSHDGVDGIITNGNTATIVEILPSDKGFKTSGCGGRSKIQ